MFRHIAYRRILSTIVICLSMIVTVKLYTSVAFTACDFRYADGVCHRIHHPFLLSDNRHYTFYVWRRIYRFHPLVPYLLVPVYLACAWAWYLRAGASLAYLRGSAHR